MSENQSLGTQGENLAAQFLEKKGYKILHRNWRSGKKELDIVAEKEEWIVFVEVKTRSENYKLSANDIFTRDKQRQIMFAAEAYIRKYNIEKESRFDVIIIIKRNKLIDIEHIEDAFYPTLR